MAPSVLIASVVIWFRKREAPNSTSAPRLCGATVIAGLLGGGDGAGVGGGDEADAAGDGDGAGADGDGDGPAGFTAGVSDEAVRARVSSTAMNCERFWGSCSTDRACCASAAVICGGAGAGD